MKTIKMILPVLLIPFFAGAQTADDLVDKYLKATDPKGVIEEVTAFKYNRSYVANANTDYDEEVVVLMGESNKLSRKKTLLKRDFFYVLSGNEGWVKIPMGSMDKKATYNVKALSTKEVEELNGEAEDGILPFLDFQSKGYKLTSPVSKATIDGKVASKLAIEKEGIEREYYFSDATGLVVREVWIENNITHTMDHDKYEETSLGVKLPVNSTYSNSREKRKTKVTTKWTFEDPAKGVSFTK